MKKTIIHIISLLLVSMTMVSCDDIFRDEPNNKLSETTIWESQLLLDEYVMPWYRNMDNGFSIYVTTIMKGIGREYEPWYADQLTVGKREWYQGDYGDILKSSQQEITTRGRTTWGKYYTQITSINKLLENSHLIPAGEYKPRILGEAHFFRAYYYYLLLRMYGGPLLITETFDPLTDNIKFPRASYENTLKFIASEADLAVSLLAKTNTSDNIGRPTKGTALMLKGKAFFWASGVKFQNTEKDYLGFVGEDRSEEMLDSAAAAYDRVMALNVYELMPINGTSRDEIIAGYRNIFLTKNSIESIWEVQHSDDGNYDTGFGHKLDREASAPSFGATTAAYNPTQNHVNEYRMANGMRITDSGSGYDKANPYDNRDYRFYANILYDGAQWKGHTMEIHYDVIDGKEVAGADLTPYGSSTSAAVTRTGYYMAKFMRESQPIDNDEVYGSSQNCILWRYAELLLDYAEIDYKKGRTGDAMAKLNQIRRRVHMPEYTSITWEDILNERRVELAFEKTTYWDLLRYGTAEKMMTGTTNPLTGVKIVNRANGSKSIAYPTVNGRNTVVRYFRPRQYYWPIAWDDVRYHEIEQNPEWVEM